MSYFIQEMRNQLNGTPTDIDKVDRLSNQPSTNRRGTEEDWMRENRKKG